MSGRPLVLALTDGLADRRLAVGDRLFERGSPDNTVVAVLVEGRLAIGVDGDRLPDVVLPGTFVGEVGALLGVPRTVDVTAAEESVVRIVGDPDSFFESHPAVALELARQLAGRLHNLTSYLEDVRRQYADADGHLTMVDSVLGRLANRPAVAIEGGSDRSPDY
jgi:CRP-like cAMP-binding protein